jgi:hypothetical protein
VTSLSPVAAGEFIITLAEIDLTDTTGRLNKGLEAYIGKYSHNGFTTTLDWMLSRASGSNYCSFVGADYASTTDKVVALFLTDQLGEYFYLQLLTFAASTGVMDMAMYINYSFFSDTEIILYKSMVINNIDSIYYVGAVKKFYQTTRGSGSWTSYSGFKNGRRTSDTWNYGSCDDIYTWTLASYSALWAANAPASTTTAAASLDFTAVTLSSWSNSIDLSADYSYQSYHDEANNLCARDLTKITQADITYYIGEDTYQH